MSMRCIFYLEGHTVPCEVLLAQGIRSIPEDALDRLQCSFCSSENFTQCSLFKQLERGLARANIRLDFQTAA